jgi:NAD+ diphosphatase
MRMGWIPSVAPPAALDAPALWFAFRGHRLLVRLREGRAEVPVAAELAELGLVTLRRQYLGTLDGRHCFSAELTESEAEPEGWSYLGLRRLFGLLPEPMLWLAGAAVQIVDWDRTHLFCGRCGSPTETMPGERAKQCPRCGLVSYPRISPAIIVLVERGASLLLARSHRQPAGFYSVLAGFVEPGETLEAAVAREIREEVGLEVSDIRYFGSQPWPFPNSLMIAFIAQHASGEIRLGEEEMEEAAWFTSDRLPQVPPPISIARQMIDWFVAKQAAASGDQDGQQGGGEDGDADIAV